MSNRTRLAVAGLALVAGSAAAAPPAPEMVAIKGGCVVLGPGREGPEAWTFKQCLRPFRIDRTETTTADYGKCVAAGACGKPRGRDDRVHGDDLPVSGLTWDDARTYCRWRGKRLPTDAEWERAARGARMTRYPWGNQPPTLRLAAMHSDDPPVLGPAPVCSHPKGISAEGLCDMAGNVEEWVDGWWADAVDPRPVDPPPAGAGEGMRVTRGGSVWDSAAFFIGWERDFKRGTDGRNAGVRCAADEPDPQRP